MDKRKHYKIVLDTETCPLDTTIQDVLPENMFVYDCGWAVVDKHGEVYKTQSYVNADIFLDEKTLMQSAYYSSKIPMYWERIKSGETILTSFYRIREALLSDIAEYNVTEVFAHNMRFDYGTLNNTQRWLTKSKYRYFFPYDIKICDTLKMARDVILPTPSYRDYCIRNGFLTSKGIPRLTAEIIYKYISGDDDFIEEHTGLADVMIEKEIMAYCYKKHKKMRTELFD